MTYPETVKAVGHVTYLWIGSLPMASLFTVGFELTCSDQKKIYIGDDNPLTLTVKAQNQGEGAYEAELIVSIPPQADFIGVVRNNEVSKRAVSFENHSALPALININEAGRI